MIKSLSLSNFKSFKSLAMDFSPLTILSGLNCAGKSSILEALKIIYRLYALNDINYLVDDKDFDSLVSQLSKERFFKIISVWDAQQRDYVYKKDAPFDVITGQPLDPNCLRIVSADRIGPQDEYRILKKNRGYLWGENGEDVYDFISKAEENHLLVENKLQIAKSPKFLDNVVQWLSIVSPNVDLSIRYSENRRMAFPLYNGVTPIETGFGLSSTLPVIVALLDPTPGTVIIENPEIHLHPKGQSELGKLIARSVSDTKQVILETHSDHIIDGIRVATANSDIIAKNVSFVFVSRDSYEKESTIKKITVDQAGNLSEWPKDFFDQSIVDAKDLMKNKVNKIEKFFT